MELLLWTLQEKCYFSYCLCHRSFKLQTLGWTKTTWSVARAETIFFLPTYQNMFLKEVVSGFDGEVMMFTNISNTSDHINLSSEYLFSGYWHKIHSCHWCAISAKCMVQSAILYVPIYRDDACDSHRAQTMHRVPDYCTCRLQSKNKTLP